MACALLSTETEDLGPGMMLPAKVLLASIVEP